MIKIKCMASCKLIIFSLLLFVILNGCNDYHIKKDDFPLSLKTAYQRLYLTKFGLEYPPRQEVLDRCKQNNDSCIETYQSVQEGKSVLLSKISIDPEKVLSFTLHTICTQCEKADKTSNKSKSFELYEECFGALTALFFFNKENQDKVILDRLLKASQQVLSMISMHKFEWFHNRPKPERWIEAIEKLPDDQLEQWKKETIIEELKKNIKDIEKFGIML